MASLRMRVHLTTKRFLPVLVVLRMWTSNHYVNMLTKMRTATNNYLVLLITIEEEILNYCLERQGTFVHASIHFSKFSGLTQTSINGASESRYI